jgi:hypothetical protein
MPLGAYEGVLRPVQINEMPLVSAVLRHARVGTDWIEGAARVVFKTCSGLVSTNRRGHAIEMI